MAEQLVVIVALTLAGQAELPRPSERQTKSAPDHLVGADLEPLSSGRHFTGRREAADSHKYRKHRQ